MQEQDDKNSIMLAISVVRTRQRAAHQHCLIRMPISAVFTVADTIAEPM